MGVFRRSHSPHTIFNNTTQTTQHTPQQIHQVDWLSTAQHSDNLPGAKHHVPITNKQHSIQPTIRLWIKSQL